MTGRRASILISSPLHDTALLKRRSLMAIGRIQPGLWRQFVLWTLTAALIVAAVGFERKAWSEAGEEPWIDELKKSLEEIEAAIDSEDITAETLAGFRDKL